MPNANASLKEFLCAQERAEQETDELRDELELDPELLTDMASKRHLSGAMEAIGEIIIHGRGDAQEKVALIRDAYFELIETVAND